MFLESIHWYQLISEHVFSEMVNERKGFSNSNDGARDFAINASLQELSNCMDLHMDRLEVIIKNLVQQLNLQGRLDREGRRVVQDLLSFFFKIFFEC